MFVAAAIVSVLLALAVLGSAAGKLTKNPKAIAPLEALSVPASWVPKLALAEIAGGVGLLVGLAVAPIGIAAAAGIIAYFVGAVITHVRAGDKNLAPPAVFGLLGVLALVLRIASA